MDKFIREATMQSDGKDAKGRSYDQITRSGTSSAGSMGAGGTGDIGKPGSEQAGQGGNLQAGRTITHCFRPFPNTAATADGRPAGPGAQNLRPRRGAFPGFPSRRANAGCPGP